MELRIADCRLQKEQRSASPSSLVDNPGAAVCNRNAGNCRGRNCSLPQSMIAKHQRGHRFHDRHRSGKNARIMASARSELSLLARTGHRLLFVGDRSGRLKRDAKINLLPITDATLHAAGIVSCGANSSAAHLKWIVMLRAPHSRCRETGTNLESLRCRYTKHRFSQIRIELVENRFTESGWNAAYYAFNHAANRIAFVANLFDQGHHLSRCHGIRAANNTPLDLLPLYGGTIDFRNDFMNLRDVGDNLEFRTQH